MSRYAMMRTATLSDSDMGVALPLPLAAEDLARDALWRVFAQYDINDGVQLLSIVYHGRSYLSAKVRSFINATVDYCRTAHASQALEPPSSACPSK